MSLIVVAGKIKTHSHGRFAYFRHDLVRFKRKLMDLNSAASSKI